MTNTLLRPTQWAESEFASAQLGDLRRTQRLVKIATNLVQKPGGTLPQAFPTYSELKAAYRFFNQPKVTFEQIQQPHWRRTRAACQEPGEYLLIEDTTDLDYTAHPATEEMGPIGDGRGRGLRLHTTLAVRLEGWDLEERPQGIVVGVLAQQCGNRWGQPRRRGETWRELMSRVRESQRWGAVFEAGGPRTTDRWRVLAANFEFRVSNFEFRLPRLAPGFRATLGGTITTRLCGQSSNSFAPLWKSWRRASRPGSLLTPAPLSNEPSPAFRESAGWERIPASSIRRRALGFSSGSS